MAGFNVFGTLPTIDGYDVIANDTGRPVAHRETLHSANGVAFRLNEAAAAGQKAMERALGAKQPQDPEQARDAQQPQRP